MNFLPDFTFLKDLDGSVAIVFIICFMILAVLYLILRHLRKQKEEDDIHIEILDQNESHKKIMKMYYSNKTNIPPPNDNVVFFEEYKKLVEKDILDEKKNMKYRNSSPVRDTKKRIKSFHIKKRSN